MLLRRRLVLDPDVVQLLPSRPSQEGVSSVVCLIQRANGKPDVAIYVWRNHLYKPRQCTLIQIVVVANRQFCFDPASNRLAFGASYLPVEMTWTSINDVLSQLRETRRLDMIKVLGGLIEHAQDDWHADQYRRQLEQTRKGEGIEVEFSANDLRTIRQYLPYLNEMYAIIARLPADQHAYYRSRP
jgi:hypothetical protein